jgi:hypothetical protein
MSEKPYAENPPIIEISATAGKIAEGAIPAGKLNTPAPTILLTRLNTSLGIVAVPVPVPTTGLLLISLSAGAMRNGAANLFLTTSSGDIIDDGFRTVVTGGRRAVG